MQWYNFGPKTLGINLYEKLNKLDEPMAKADKNIKST